MINKCKVVQLGKITQLHDTEEIRRSPLPQLYLALFYVSKCKKLKPFLFANQFLS